MLKKEQIIVFHTIKHSDKGLVINAYSNLYGKCAYYYYASKKSSLAAYLNPLTILDVVVFYRHTPGSGSGLPLLKEINLTTRLDNIKTDLHKSSVAIFICELLNKSIREIEPNSDLFEYISNSIQLLNELDSGVENFHLYFIANLSRVLGYMPNNNYSANNQYFNFTIGSFVEHFNEKNCFDLHNSKLLNSIITTPISQLNNINCTGKKRSEFLQLMLNYIELHSQCELHLKSLAVLSEIFNSHECDK